jgi:molybdopterin-binding protein
MVKVCNLSLKLGGFRLNDLSFSVKRGEYFVLLGPTGAGKTTLLEVVCGLKPLDSGEIWIDGKQVTNIPTKDRNIGYLFQEPLLFPHLDVFSNVVFGLKIKGVKKKEIGWRFERISELLKISKLKGQSPLSLSGGEKQKVALAGILITSPKLLLLDEPLSSLDPQSRKELRLELLRIHRELGMTTIHVTHSFSEALHLADRIGIIHDGKILQQGEPEVIFSKPSSEIVADFVEIKNLFKGRVIKADGRQWVELAPGLRIETLFDRDAWNWGQGSDEEVRVGIRPEDIFLSNTPISSSAKNIFQGKVVEILNMGTFHQIGIEVKVVKFFVYITKASVSQLELAEGKDVFLTFKASSVIIF